MATRPVQLRPARDALGYVERLLDRNGLPTRDVRRKPDCFFLAVRDGDRVGVGGLEPYGSVGVLRSVVVEASSRGRGVGTALCDALETRATSEGIERLYLLTTTAAAFFRTRGYTRVDRAAVPDAVRTSAEFEELCPSTATCLCRSLPAETASRSGTR
jgi:amino-acid N-acetyltransferase